MALSETANLVVKLSLGGNFMSQIGKATAGLGKLEKGSSRAYKAGAQIGTGIKNAGRIAAVGIGALATQVAFGLDSLIKLEQAEAQTAAVLKSTKQAAGQNGAAITALSEKYEGLNALVGDEFVRAGANMLLTFTRIKGKAFEPALAAILDVNTAMGKGPEGLTKTAIQVGKALNDPVKGLTALTRIGVTFSAKQQKRIKDLVAEGKTYEAQRVILKELNKEFGGSFLAQGNTTAGSVAKFGDAIEDLQRSLATALLPTVRNVADALTDFLADPEVVRGAKDLGTTIAGVFTKDKIKDGIAALGSVVKTIRGAMPAIVSAASAIGSVVGKAVELFNTLSPELKTLLVAGVGVNKLTGGLVTNVAGGIVGAILGQLRSAHVSVTGAVVQVNGPVAGLPGAGGGGVNPVAAGAGLTGAAALGIGAVGVSAALLGAVNSPLWVRNTTLNTKLEEAGLTRAERAAQQYYSASAADQAQMRKRLLVLPTKADYDSGNQKLKQVVSAKLDDTRDSTDRVKEAALETKREAAKGAAFGSQGITATRTGAATVAQAVRASRPIVSVNVAVTANSYTQKVNVSTRYGSPNGSRNQGNIGDSGAR